MTTTPHLPPLHIHAGPTCTCPRIAGCGAVDSRHVDRGCPQHGPADHAQTMHHAGPACLPLAGQRPDRLGAPYDAGDAPTGTAHSARPCDALCRDVEAERDQALDDLQANRAHLQLIIQSNRQHAAALDNIRAELDDIRAEAKGAHSNYEELAAERDRALSDRDQARAELERVTAELATMPCGRCDGTGMDSTRHGDVAEDHPCGYCRDGRVPIATTADVAVMHRELSRMLSADLAKARAELARITAERDRLRITNRALTDAADRWAERVDDLHQRYTRIEDELATQRQIAEDATAALGDGEQGTVYDHPTGRGGRIRRLLGRGGAR